MANKILILFFILMELCLPTYSQNKVWPPHNWEDGPRSGSRSHHVDINGVIGFTNNDSLRGCIRLYQLLNGISILLPNETKGRRLKHREELAIKNIQLDTIINGRKLVYESISKGNFWRMIAKKDNVGIYDNIDTDFNLVEYGTRMILVSNGKRIKIYGKMPWILRDTHIAPLLLNFINKRYKSTFKPEDFKDATAMFDYILDKESETSKKK